MLSIHFRDWRKRPTKKHYDRLHELRIFELIFSSKLTESGVELGGFTAIHVFCMADEKKVVSLDENRAMGEIGIFIPDDFMNIIGFDSTEDKFQSFSQMVQQYVAPVLKRYSSLAPSTIELNVEEALNEVVKQKYEAVFLVDKTPKKSPNRKNIAILKGVHRSEGFQLRCEVYNEKGLRIVDELLVEEAGNEMVYARFLGTLRWETDHHIVVKSKSSSWKAEIYL